MFPRKRQSWRCISVLWSDALSSARQSKPTLPISRSALVGRTRRLQRKNAFLYSRGHRYESSPVPCSFTSSIAIRIKTSLSMCLQITRRWYDHCFSAITKIPDRPPKSCSTIGLVSKRKSLSSASTKTTLTHCRGCQKMRSAYGYAVETS